MYEVIPGILEKEWSEIEKKIELVKPFAHSIHIDIIDGKFASNTTFLDPKPFKKYTGDLFFELHMMVEEPINYLKPFADVGFKRFLGHIEKMSDQTEFIAQAQLLGEVGIAIDGPTPVSIIENIPLDDLDCILVYTSERVGFSGPPFLPERLDKVRKIREKSQIPIEVDGGINNDTIVHAKNAGVTRFISTSFLFHNGNPKEKYSLLQKIVTESE